MAMLQVGVDHAVMRDNPTVGCKGKQMQYFSRHAHFEQKVCMCVRVA